MSDIADVVHEGTWPVEFVRCNKTKVVPLEDGQAQVIARSPFYLGMRYVFLDSSRIPFDLSHDHTVFLDKGEVSLNFGCGLMVDLCKGYVLDIPHDRPYSLTGAGVFNSLFVFCCLTARRNRDFSSPVLAEDLHPKVWGSEAWIANTQDYCGKRLVLTPGHMCSVHYHKVKDETFYVREGHMRLELFDKGYPGTPTVLDMHPGDSVHVPVGLAHRFKGIEQTVFFEFSTKHMEEDSYRLVPSA